MNIQKKIIWKKDQVAIGELSYEDKGKSRVRTYVELLKRVVLIVPLDPDHVYLLKEYRPLLDKTVWRLPAGHLDENEEPINGATRELLEETGLIAEKITLIGSYEYLGWVKFPLFVFKAQNLTQHEQQLEFYEKIDLIKITKQEARKIALHEMVEPHHAFALLKSLEK